MSKNNIHSRIQCLNDWLVEIRKKAKFGTKVKTITYSSVDNGEDIISHNKKSFIKKK